MEFSICTPIDSCKENADAALRRIRRPSVVRNLWVDAICIDQRNNREKDSQWPLMRNIYEQAEQVCVWLGEMTDASPICVCDIKSRVAKEYKPWVDKFNNTVMANLMSPTGVFTNGFNGIAAEFTAGLTYEVEIGELRELLSRPWCTRVWVMQEVIGIERAIKRNLSSLRGTVELLYEFRRLHCTDPGDRIFGILGLAAGARDYRIFPDSRASTAEVFLVSARTIIAQSGTLDLLNCKREWKGIENKTGPDFAYSLVDQAKYHDIKAAGWATLPPGWERVQPFEILGQHDRSRSNLRNMRQAAADKIYHYIDHNTGTSHRTSPLHVAKQKILPAGWIKEWDNLCRARIRQESRRRQQKISDVSPSWVLNWCGRRHVDPDPLLDWSEENPRYWAAGNTVPGLDLDQENPQILGVEGIYFDEIIKITGAWNPTSNTPPVSRRGIPVLETWETFALSEVPSCPYADTGGRKGALWRTLIADYAGHLAAPLWGRSYVEKLPDLDEMATKSLWATARTTTELQTMRTPMFTELLETDHENAHASSSAGNYGEYLCRIHRVCAHRAFGDKTPFLLREVPEVAKYELVGEAFV
ncbi:heterokaryon incompatibility protein-domain-containing protein [Podospora didyma]|uniref:Heterokaryon incompatibility protein-domain-containing protein n=1 Tax=Podospora didyma TaxID=330526 RepID=A0AAE0N9H1_9PEZI|nr:heterokaryon incompatibility protein-domain-containing protein [Podospora didyma]